MDPAPTNPTTTNSSHPSPHPRAPSCPSWCIRDHADQDPDDQLHEGHTRLLGAITLERSPGEAPNNITRHAVATELTITRYQYPDDPDEWIYIGDGRHGLDLSIESVRRLMWVLGRVVGWGRRSGPSSGHH